MISQLLAPLEEFIESQFGDSIVADAAMNDPKHRTLTITLISKEHDPSVGIVGGEYLNVTYVPVKNRDGWVISSKVRDVELQHGLVLHFKKARGYEEELEVLGSAEMLKLVTKAFQYFEG